MISDTPTLYCSSQTDRVLEIAEANGIKDIHDAQQDSTPKKD